MSVVSTTIQKTFRAPRWVIRVHQLAFFIAIAVFLLGLYYAEQIPARGDTVPSAERPYQTRPGKGSGKVYYLNGADYFRCQQLPLLGFIGLLAPCATFAIYGWWAARRTSRLDDKTG